MKIKTETINGKIWHIAEFTKQECEIIGLEYPTFSVWEHDEEIKDMQTKCLQPSYWWLNSETDADSYDEAIKWCSQFGK